MFNTILWYKCKDFSNTSNHIYICCYQYIMRCVFIMFAIKTFILYVLRDLIIAMLFGLVMIQEHAKRYAAHGSVAAGTRGRVT